jgi:septal ring factor EnvC (AmiA/AmiB activator)
MARVLPYLDEDEVNKLGSVCKITRKLIFSPMGLKMIVYNRTRRMAEYFRDNVMTKGSFHVVGSSSDADHFGNYRKDIERFSQMAAESFKEDQSEEINALRNVKKFLTLKLSQNQATLESMQKEIVVLNELLQNEKKEKRQLGEKLMGLEEIKESNKEVLKDLNLKYVNIVFRVYPDQRASKQRCGIKEGE